MLVQQATEKSDFNLEPTRKKSVGLFFCRITNLTEVIDMKGELIPGKKNFKDLPLKETVISRDLVNILIGNSSSLFLERFRYNKKCSFYFHRRLIGSLKLSKLTEVLELI